MTPPKVLWHVEWQENFRAKAKVEERRYKTSVRAARQVAAILAAPDTVAELRGVWISDGWSKDRIEWTELDPAALLASVNEPVETDDLDDEKLSPIEHYERIHNAWRDAEERQ